MEKCWFVLISGEQKGPYSVRDLRNIKEITPDTLAWKEGLLNWTPIRDIPELDELFEEPEQEDEEQRKTPQLTQDDTLALDASEPPVFLWLLFALLVLIYLIFQLYYR